MAKVTISEGHFDGERLVTTRVQQINPSVCPHVIFMPSHYRDDGSCRCDDPKEKIMRSWGYTWSRTKKRWV
jgi:hypothetical protein